MWFFVLRFLFFLVTTRVDCVIGDYDDDDGGWKVDGYPGLFVRSVHI
jgi:hypothetical protein